MAYCRKLLHGTSARNAAKILQEGLAAGDRRVSSHRGSTGFYGSYLTDSSVVADYFAKEAVGIDVYLNGVEDRPVILEVTVSEDKLRADYVSYVEPLSFYRNRWAKDEDDWHRKLTADRIPYPKSGRDWRTSLKVVRAVRHEGRIPPECIRLAKWYVPESG